MQEKEIKFTLKTYNSPGELPQDEAELLHRAKSALEHSYSPYSGFKVSAAVLLANGEILTGTNQENASFPAGICAEGTVLSAVSAQYPGVAVQKMAITVKSNSSVVSQPAAPCGICRQRLLEYEHRFNQPIKIIMMGVEDPVNVVDSVKDLLPLYFSKTNL